MKASASVRGLMRKPAHDPRPYPEPFSPSERAVIEHALFEGILALKGANDLDLKTCDEVDINNKLEWLLNRMLDSDPSAIAGFSKAIFQTVVRGAELNNHDGTLPEKRPDLAFRSTRSHPGLAFPEQCVLLVECKIADPSRPMNFYCKEGLERFIDGTYAWAVSSAIMLGYARQGYSPKKQLHIHLTKYGNNYNLVSPLKKRDPGMTSPDFYVTVHDRTKVKEMPTGPEGRITIHHLWVKID
jgi:hypothetical protein